MKDNIKSFLELPYIVAYDGVIFTLLLRNEAKREASLGYYITSVEEDSAHYETHKYYGCWANPFLPDVGFGYSFLFLQGGLKSNIDFLKAIQNAKGFLMKNGLMKDEYKVAKKASKRSKK